MKGYDLNLVKKESSYQSDGCDIEQIDERMFERTYEFNIKVEEDTSYIADTEAHTQDLENKDINFKMISLFLLRENFLVFERLII